jgi:hypothetical protein
VSVLPKPISKLQIKLRREEFAGQAMREKEAKRKTLCGDFALPTQDAPHELYCSWKTKKGQAKERAEEEEFAQDLDRFERKLMLKFK